MRKICHLTSVHHRHDTRILYKECISLANNGYEVHLVVADGKKDEEINMVKIYDVGKYEGRVKRFFKSTKKVYEKALEIDADIYHFHDPELMPIGAKLKKRGKKVICDVHEDLPRQIMSKHYIKSYLRKPLSVFVEMYEDYVCKKFDFIITATPHIRKRFIKLNESLDINNYPLLKDLDTEITDWEDKKNEVCYIGAITKIRGLQEVVMAMGHVDNETKLNLAGNFSPKSFKEDLGNTKGWENTNYLGQIPRNEVQRIMKASKVGLVTFLPFGNHIHSQPNKLFEYMSQGIPLVASNFDLWKDIIEVFDCGICVEPSNPEEITNAIDFFINNPKKAEKMGENGRNAVLSKYNWESEEKKLIEIYKQI